MDNFTVAPQPDTWMTKPTDRFVLRWIKLNLSARLTPRLLDVNGLKPWMITVASMVMGVSAGLLFSLGWGFAAGLFALISQVLDGVDGQLARIKGSDSPAGAFLDSILDRYTDGALIIGLTVYNTRTAFIEPAPILIIGAAALIGCSLISYSTSRAECLHICLGRPTLVSKGTRSSAIVLAGLLSPLLPLFPLIVLVYLALHCSTVVIYRIIRAYHPATPKS